MQPCPGFTQYPQLSLQQASPAAHWFGPHFGPGSGAQSWRVHGLLGRAQIPQESLQHTSLDLQVLVPHLGPEGGAEVGLLVGSVAVGLRVDVGLWVVVALEVREREAEIEGWQSNLIHPFPGGVQIPQLWLQHDSPEGHMLGPHSSPFALTSTSRARRAISNVGSGLRSVVRVSGGGRWQRSLMHPFPGGVQIPHEGLQHAWPTGQTLGPHSGPVMGGGTQVAVLLMMVQMSPLAQSTRAQSAWGSRGVVGVDAARAGRRRRRGRRGMAVVELGSGR